VVASGRDRGAGWRGLVFDGTGKRELDLVEWLGLCGKREFELVEWLKGCVGRTGKREFE
jgi:hypothetical protein